MASFSVPEVQDNAEGWGPASDAVPEHLKFLVRPPFVAPPGAFGVATMLPEASACEPAGRVHADKGARTGSRSRPSRRATGLDAHASGTTRATASATVSGSAATLALASRRRL